MLRQGTSMHDMMSITNAPSKTNADWRAITLTSPKMEVANRRYWRSLALLRQYPAGRS